jgi:poly-beta-1,6-N-acetyl-D-glucosamine synthase
MQYVVITPVRNEAAHVERTIESMSRQTILPAQWVIVDDGSSDATPAMLSAATTRYPWVTVVRRADRGFRNSGGGVVEAFDAGYDSLRRDDWDFVVKLDGDLEFEPDYFEQCLRHFSHDLSLGIAGGTVYVRDDGKWRVDSPGDPPFHVRGATKIYRRACWQAIGPLVPYPGWDTIDEVRANMKGWSTRSLAGIMIYQQRATGAVDGNWQNWFKNGVANYVTGYHPLFMLAKCVRRFWGSPPVLPAFALWIGFCSGYINGLPRIDDASAIAYLRKEQLRRLFLRDSIYGNSSSSGPRAAMSARD